MIEGSLNREESVQSVVEALSIALARPVLLDDETLAPLAYSAQWGEIDRVRSESIFSRRASTAVGDALRAEGIQQAADVVRTRPVPGLGMAGRICAPVRRNDRLLGYIWILDEEGSLDTEELRRVRSAARTVAELLAQSDRRPVPDEGELLTALCSADPVERGRGLQAVRSPRRLPEQGLVMCLLQFGAADPDPVAAVLRATRRLSAGCALAGATPHGAALVVSVADPVMRPLGEDQIATWLHAIIGSGAQVGQSAVATLAALPEAARQAAVALRVAGSRGPESGSASAAWSTIGADRLVAQLPASALGDLPDRLVRLLRDEPELAETLASFLDRAGDVKATSAALSLHRSGLYYRLRRIEELSGLRLDAGDDRLVAHIALRAMRLR